MSESERLGLNYPGITSTTATQAASSTRVTPREEPYLEPSHLDKPILDIYEGQTGDLDYHLLEEPESGFAWIRAHKHDFVDVEAHR